ncbi:glycosyltransferase family 4 protein [Histomonas meleagridis]|uniref:glycosyltransferase family 4 protein n=1 Tax=Histomonas meleagridis TaxID=135588 RepID=UPI003559EB9E|nr:glycosyltransferase family 4 protein [Histomonas meleagridis]KAH0801098.1 glycosyltransferase family 4 protein [Histomonas meleagridis]
MAALYFRRKKKNSVVFFHPNCLDCAGGERVLWAAVDSLKDKNIDIAIYSQECTYDQAKEKIFKSFDMVIPSHLRFINVGTADFIKPGRYPRFTLIMQALSSIVYVFKCLMKEVPSVVIDTTGAPFASFVWKLFGGCTVIFYIHYPYISTDMLSKVKSNETSFNNDQEIAKSSFLTNIKILYYRILCFFYSLTSKFMDITMVNSTWTSNHIESIYGKKPVILYPPCDCRQFGEFPIENREKGFILSVGQFRPEKNYFLQLEIMEKLSKINEKAHLVIVGGCRNEIDRLLLNDLQKVIDEKKLKVELCPNVPYEQLKQLLRKADIGLHTMRDEHFGICVVEYMAAGLIPISNRSAGPLMDIVKDTNYLALTCDEYVEKLERALNDHSDDVRIRFRKESQKFSLENFEQNFIKINIDIIQKSLNKTL